MTGKRRPGLGITPQLMDTTLYDAFGQSQVSTMYTTLNQYHVVMEVAPQFWQNPQGLNDIYVHSTNGGEVPLSAVAHFEAKIAPLAVNHQGQFPSVTVSFNLAPGVALSDADAVIRQAESDIGHAAPHSRHVFGDAAGVSSLASHRTDADHHRAAGSLHRAGNSL